MIDDAVHTVRVRPRIETPRHPGRGVETWLLIVFAGAVLAIGGWFLVDEYTGVDRQIDLLVTDWTTAWNAGDGDAVVALMTPGGRHVCSLQPAPGVAGEELAGFVAMFRTTFGFEGRHLSDPVIVESSDGYLVTVALDGGSVGAGHSYFRIVDRDGQLLIAYHEFLH